MSRLAVVPVAGGEPKIYARQAGPRRLRAAIHAGRQLDSVPGRPTTAGSIPRRVPANGGEVAAPVRSGPGVINSLEQGKDGQLAVLAASDTSRPRSTRSRTANSAR